MMANRADLGPEELEQQTAAELPDREVMTLINTDPGMLTAYPDTTGGLDSTPAAGGDMTGGASDPAQASDLANSQVPAPDDDSGGSTIISYDRTDVFSQQDSAYAGPE
jgi:hypothetical protein